MEIKEYMKNDMLFDYGCKMYIKESNDYTKEQNLEMKKFLKTIYNDKIRTPEGICICLKYKDIFKEYEKTDIENSVLTKYWKEKTNS